MGANPTKDEDSETENQEPPTISAFDDNDFYLRSGSHQEIMGRGSGEGSGKPGDLTEILANAFNPNQDSMREKKCCGGIKCLRIFYVSLGVVIILLSITLIAVSVSTAIATKIYSSDMSGRLVAMILMAVTAGFAMSMSIYAIIAVFRKTVRPLHATSAVLVMLAVIQAFITGISVRVTADDELVLSESLVQSFQLSINDNLRHVKIWALTQYDLSCCGVYSPQDYSRPGVPSYFPPDVPISCCATFDPDRSEIVQERARQVCKATRSYFHVGCKSLVVQVFKETAVIVMTVAIALIVFEVIEAILGSMLSKEQAKEKDSANEIQRTVDLHMNNNNAFDAEIGAQNKPNKMEKNKGITKPPKPPRQ